MFVFFHLIDYQLLLTARDGGSPQLEVTQVLPVTVSVSRNQFAPNFVNDPYEKVLELPVSSADLLFTVTAVDNDPSVCSQLCCVQLLSLIHI